MRRPLRSILLVEDDPDIREIASLSLEALGGFDVSTVDCGAAALETVSALDPDLIILDYMMPQMDGSQVLAALRADPASAATPVVFMTAKVRTDEVAKFKAMGAVDVIPKPFDPAELPQRIQSIWADLDE